MFPYVVNLLEFIIVVVTIGTFHDEICQVKFIINSI